MGAELRRYRRQASGGYPRRPEPLYPARMADPLTPLAERPTDARTLSAPAPATGLIEGFVADGRGGAVPLDASELMANPLMGPPEGGYLWMHFALEAARGWVPANLGLDDDTLRALFADETRPRCTRKGDALLMNLRGVNLNEGAALEDMVSLRIHLMAGRLITVRRQKSVAVEEIRLEMRAGVAPPDAASLTLRIVAGLTDRIEPVVDALSDRVDAYEELSVTQGSVDLRAELSAMRHDAIVFRRYVAPQREAVARFAANDAHILPEEAQSAAKEEADRVTRVVEELDIVRERAAVIQDQIAARRADEMNRNMMIISVVSAVFLPLGFLTGLLGINVGGMPGAENEVAFWIVCALCAGLGAALLVVFRRMGWLSRS